MVVPLAEGERHDDLGVERLAALPGEPVTGREHQPVPAGRGLAEIAESPVVVGAALADVPLTDDAPTTSTVSTYGGIAEA